MLTMGLSFITLRYEPSTPSFFRAFIMRGCWNLSKVFLHLLVWSYDFFYLRFYYIYWFMHVDPSLNLRNKTNFIVVYYFLMCCWIQFANILLRSFVLYSSRILSYSFLFLSFFFVLFFVRFCIRVILAF
jgi:hypothetical protein